MDERGPVTSRETIARQGQGGLSRNVRLLGLVSLINDVASEMIYPLVPTFLVDVLRAGPAALGAVEGIADTTASVVKLWSGAVSDRAGKRKIFVVVGYACAAVARPLVGVSAAAWQVLLVRFTDRFGKGIRSAPRDAMIADSTEPELRGRAFGYNRAMDHLGAVIGPALAFAFLSIWPDQFRALFLLTIVPGIVVVLLVLLGVREKPVTAPAAKEFWFTLAPFDRRFRVYLLALVVFTLGNSSDAFLLLRLGELGVSPGVLPLAWGAFHIVKSGGSLLAGAAVDRLGPRPLIFAGWIIYAAIYLAFSLATDAAQGWAIFLVYGVFHALTEPAERTLVANLVEPSRQGLAFGWFNFAVGIAALPASLAFGAIYQLYGAQAAFTWGAVLAIVAVLILGAFGRGTTAKLAAS
jgi:MFS family permease